MLGRLFLEDAEPKNIATCLKADKFLSFFFSQVRPNDLGWGLPLNTNGNPDANTNTNANANPNANANVNANANAHANANDNSNANASDDVAPKAVGNDKRNERNPQRALRCDGFTLFELFRSLL